MSEPRPVTVIVFARLFQGLADSLENRVWRPGGVPAIYRLLEALAVEPDVKLVTVFAAKDPYDGRFAKAARFDLDPIGRVHILPYRPRPPLARLRLIGKWIELHHLVRSIALMARYRPNIAYFTNAHFVTAGLVARLWPCRTVFRFLGVTPVQRRIADGENQLARWLYRAPFDQVVSTLDGSGARACLARLLRAGVPTAVLLNGVDGPCPAPKTCAAAADERPLVLFLGRIEAQKGAREFVEAMIEVARLRPGAIRAVLVGDGSERQELIGHVERAGLGATIELTGAVAHSEVARWLARADIYVSLNKYGNLSNANLEALAAGRCMIVLDKDTQSHIDEETEAVLPRDIVLRIPRRDTARHLADEVVRLIDHPEEIERLASATRALAGRILGSWDARIARELALIRGAEERQAA